MSEILSPIELIEQEKIVKIESEEKPRLAIEIPGNIFRHGQKIKISIYGPEKIIRTAGNQKLLFDDPYYIMGWLDEQMENIIENKANKKDIALAKDNIEKVKKFLEAEAE